MQATEHLDCAPKPEAQAGLDPSDGATTSTGAVPEIKVSQRGARVGGDLYCEDCGANKPTMGDTRTNSRRDARDGVRRWCERCCDRFGQRPDAGATHPFRDGWTYGLGKFAAYGTQQAEKPTAWPQNGWTSPNSAPVQNASGRPDFVLQETSVACTMRIDPNDSATSQLVQQLTSEELRPIQPTGLANEKDEYIPEGNDRSLLPTVADCVSTTIVSRNKRGARNRDPRWGKPESYLSAMSSSTTCSGAP